MPNIVRTTLIMAVFLLGFGLRVFRLDAQSFWSDEGASVFMTARSFGEILQAAAGDIHPPLYYLLLRYWSVPVGTSEFSVRFLSLAFGVLLVALVYKLGQKLAGRDAGLAAAFLTATSPLLVYYSQEARMYMLMAALSAISVLLAMRLWSPQDDKGKRGKGEMGKGALSQFTSIAYVIVTAACLYTQYFAFTIVLFENMVFALIFWRVWQHWRAWMIWAAMQLAVAILYLPWLGQVMGQLNTWQSANEALSPLTLINRVFLVFSFGLSWDMTATAKTEMLFGALVIVGAIMGLGGKWRNGKKGELSPQSPDFPFYPFTLLYLAVPIGVMYYLSLQRPLYNPKFLLLAMPPFYVLAGLGIVGIKQSIEAVAQLFVRNLPRLHLLSKGLAVAGILLTLAGATFATSRSLDAYYFDPKYGRDDYRGLARYIDLSGRPGDAIVLNAPGQVEIFGYYYQGSLPVLPLPKQRPLDERSTEADLQEAMGKYRRIWVVFWAERESDPQGYIEGWLNQNAFRAGNRWYGNIRLVLYSVPTTTAAGTIQQQVDANLGNKVSLLGYSLNSSDTGAAGEPIAKPGEVLQLTLFWQALAKLEERYIVFTHLIDAHEHIWGQRDAEPGSGAKPTTGWTPGVIVADNYGIPIFAGTPPGEYYVEIGLYLPVTWQRLQVLGQSGEVRGDRLLFGPIKVGKANVPPAIESLPVETTASADFGPLRLAGYEFYKLGSERGNVDFRRGDIARLALFWQARERPGKDYRVVVRVTDANGRQVIDKQNAPADGNYPSGQWDKSEVVLDQHKLLLDLPPGKYKLAVGLEDSRSMVKIQGTGSKDDMLELREITVR